MSKNIVVAALIIILLLAGIGFLIFGLIQSVTDDDDDTPDTTVELVGENDEDGEEDGDQQETEGEETQEQGSVSDEALTDQEEAAEDQGEVSGASSEQTSKYAPTSTVYKAGNDYEFGDIEGSTYVVKKGDTLWQIAEARYGTGYAWVDINNANGEFPLLPDGTPVFLRIGQTIVLPDL
jgi:nucleoid-associated protein YgaU